MVINIRIDHKYYYISSPASSIITTAIRVQVKILAKKKTIFPHRFVKY